MAKRISRKAGFTIQEMMVVLMILGLMAAIGVPIWSNIRKSNQQQNAIAQVALVSNARDQFALNVPNAASLWAAATSDEDKLNLLIANNLLRGSASDYLAMSGGYVVVLTGGIRGSTTLATSDH